MDIRLLERLLELRVAVQTGLFLSAGLEFEDLGRISRILKAQHGQRSQNKSCQQIVFHMSAAHG